MRAIDSNLTLVGLMSGTSVDGIDAAVVTVGGSGPEARVGFVGYRCYPFPSGVREALLAMASPDTACGPREIASMNFTLGELFAKAAMACAEETGVGPGRIDCIASHGQTIFHQGASAGADGGGPCTLQIGEAAVIAERTGVMVVSDFRTADMAAGGQGAPLVPYFDYVFLRGDGTSRAALNIGGIANVTYLPARCGLDDVIAFDTGPGNMLIDAAASRFSRGELLCDLDGAMASRGQVNRALLDRLLSHPFYSAPPPKSAGREQFGAHYLDTLMGWTEARGLEPEDVVATLTALTAESIARACADHLSGPVDEIIVSGGGARNPVLMSRLEAASGARARMFDEFGMPGDAKEAAAFALLASETVRGVPSNVPAATGASHPVVLGKITQAPPERGAV